MILLTALLLLVLLVEMNNRALETQRAAQEDCWLETSGLLEPADFLSRSEEWLWLTFVSR